MASRASGDAKNYSGGCAKHQILNECKHVSRKLYVIETSDLCGDVSFRYLIFQYLSLIIIATMIMNATWLCLIVASIWSCISGQKHLGTWWTRTFGNLPKKTVRGAMVHSEWHLTFHDIWHSMTFDIWHFMTFDISFPDWNLHLVQP